MLDIDGNNKGSFISLAAAAAKSLQSYPTLCNPIDCSPPGSPIPGVLQARILEWVAISFSLKKPINSRVFMHITTIKLIMTEWFRDEL